MRLLALGNLPIPSWSLFHRGPSLGQVISPLLRRPLVQLQVGIVILLNIMAVGCAPLHPRAIPAHQLLLAEQLRDGQPQIMRGQPRPVLDTAGWVIGIPDKLLLWNRRVANHRIGNHTESTISRYLADNALDTTRVRLNQYAPGDDWRRLVRNKRVAAPWRYSFGAVATLYETLLPGRLLGGDHYNPYTDTIHLYSDVPAIALHEAAHAKDFATRKYKGTYAALYLIPGVPLYHEARATDDVLAYVESEGSADEQREAYRVLYPAYGTYLGSAAGTVLPGYSSPLYYGAVVGGHIWGRALASSITDDPAISSDSTNQTDAIRAAANQKQETVSQEQLNVTDKMPSIQYPNGW